MNSLLIKVVLSWIIAFFMFMVCYAICVSLVTQYINSIAYAMIAGLFAYKISDKIASFVLVNMIYSIKQRN